MRVLIIQQGSKDNPPIKSNKYDVAVLNDDSRRCILSSTAMIMPDMSKWEAVSKYLQYQGNYIVKSYDYVWIPDKSIKVSEEILGSFFASVERTNGNFVMYTPKVHTHFSRGANIERHLTPCYSDTGTCVNLVPSYAPCFEAKFLVSTVAPFLNRNKHFLKSGAGIDKWWSKQSNGGCELKTMILKCDCYDTCEHARDEQRHFSSIR